MVNDCDQEYQSSIISCVSDIFCVIDMLWVQGEVGQVSMEVYNTMPFELKVNKMVCIDLSGKMKRNIIMTKGEVWLDNETNIIQKGLVCVFIFVTF